MTVPRVTPAETFATAAERARRMHSSGHGLHDIASTLRVHPAQVRRWLIAFEHTEAAAAHARAWRSTQVEIAP